MTWRKGHGNGAGQPRIEVLPPDELPEPKGKDTGRGGATKVKLARKLMAPDGDPSWIPYRELAEQFRRAQCRAIAVQAGGRCGVAPSSIVASAALQLALSRWMLDRAVRENDPQLVKMATTIMNDSRQNLLAAYELAVREATARRQFEKHSPHVALESALSGSVDEDVAPSKVTVTTSGLDVSDASLDVALEKKNS